MAGVGVLDRGDFLARVTGNSLARCVAAAVATARLEENAAAAERLGDALE